MIVSMRYRNSKGIGDLSKELTDLELMIKKNPAVRLLLEDWVKQFVEPALREEASKISLTGRLAQRARAKLVGSRQGYRLEVGAPYVKYAMMQEAGRSEKHGTQPLTPRSAPLLLVPIYNNKSQLASRKRPSDYSNTFTRPSKSTPGEKVIYQRTGRGKNAKATPIFALKKLVNIPPQRWITKAMQTAYPELTALLKASRVL